MNVVSNITLLFLFALLQIQLYSQVNLTKSNLPIIQINTLGQKIVDEPKIIADMKIIFNGIGEENHIHDTIYHFDGKIGIEYRGSSSQSFPKKPYGFETQTVDGEELEFKLLDMPKEADWTFNATYNDKTLMRDGLTYILAGSFMEYAPRVRYSELLINGEYQGIYLLIEKIKRGKNRVNIPKIQNTDNEGDALTGGYIIKIDKETGSNSGEGWNSKYRPYSGSWQKTFFQYEYPKAKNITESQKSYISNYVSNVEDVIRSENYADTISGYRKYIDTKSLMDYIIVNELTKNPDAYRLSTFFYKERDSDGGKIKFGPVWDYNLGLGNVNYCTNGNPEGLVITDFNQVCPSDGWVIHFWWERFLEDKTFYDELKNRWKSLRQNQLSNEAVFNTVDSLATLVSEAQVRNFERWSVLGEYVWPNYYIGDSYSDEVTFLKDWLEKRLAWLDEKWKIETVSTYQLAESDFTIYPNPVTGLTYLQSKTGNVSLTPISVSDSPGRMLDISAPLTDKDTLVYDYSQAMPGVYYIRLISGNTVQTNRILKF